MLSSILPSSVLKSLPIDIITKGTYQPRIDFNTEALQQLADSIKTQGIIQPIVVRPISNSHQAAPSYELIAGERRWRAAQLAGLDEIPALIREVSDQAVAAIALIENIQREALKPLEQAQAIQRLIHEFGLTHQQTAQELGCSRSNISNLLRLLNLGETATRLLNQGHLEMGHARALLKLNENLQAHISQKIVQKNLSVRQTERLVKYLPASTMKKAKTQTSQPEIQQLEQNLSEKLGAAVSLNYQSNGKGKLVIEYHNLDELEGILAHIN